MITKTESSIEEVADQAGILPQKSKLRLEPGGFHQELTSIIGTAKVGWYMADHEKLVNAILPRLLDENGNRADLEAQRYILDVVFYPTEERQRKVMKAAFEAAGYELDESTEDALVLLLSVTGFSDYLAKKVNAKTGKKFISKPEKGGKKKTFDALLDEQPALEQSLSADAARHEEALA